jgi:hypothetical protein
MDVIEAISADQIVGRRPGRVSMIFEAASAQAGVNFYIDPYQALPASLSNVQVYQSLQTSQ